MTKQVPEECAQIAELERFVAGNEMFARLRGKLGKPLCAIIEEMISRASSPTNFQERLDRFFGDLRPVARELAVLVRDGEEAAKRELTLALTIAEHRLPFEPTCVIPKRTFTAVMLDPPRTLAMIRWLTMRDRCSLQEHFAGRSTSLTSTLFSVFPRFALNCIEMIGGNVSVGQELSNAYEGVVRDKFEDGLKGLCSYGPRALCLGLMQWECDRELGAGWTSPPYCYLIEGTQADALSCFNRIDQCCIGTWQFELPETIDPVTQPMHHVGFHLEEEHEAWSKQEPDYVSKSVNHGMGAIVLRHNVGRGSEAWTCKQLGDVGHFGRNNADKSILRFRVE